MKSLLACALMTAAFALPAVSLAATYEYVNTQGNLETENAATPEQALTMPTDIAPHSGVILSTIQTQTANPVVTANGPEGTYMAQLTGVNTPARSLMLTLLPDSSFILTSVYGGNTPIMTEGGSWQIVGDNDIQLTITGNSNETYSPAESVLLTQSGSTLTATSYSSAVYGTQGLVFTK